METPNTRGDRCGEYRISMSSVCCRVLKLPTLGLTRVIYPWARVALKSKIPCKNASHQIFKCWRLTFPAKSPPHFYLAISIMVRDSKTHVMQELTIPRLPLILPRFSPTRSQKRRARMRVSPLLSAQSPWATWSKAHWDRREWIRYYNQRTCAPTPFHSLGC